MGHDASVPQHTAVTEGPRHHFFGYYDKTPWDATGRYMLALEAGFINRPPGSEDSAAIGVIDTEQGNAWRPLAETTAWNWQQGSMLQWLPGAPDRLIVYNSRQRDRFGAIVRDVWADEERVLPRPVYAVSPDARTALSVNFARIADTRPGYGYAGVEDPWQEDPHPADDGIYRMDLETGKGRLIVSLAQVAALGPAPASEQAKHWFNHLQFNTDGSRFGFLHRWREPGQRAWRTRLFTADPDGSDICRVADHDMVSHYDWRDPEHVLAWARQREVGDRYFLFRDGTDRKEIIGDGVLTTDGHCSFSPDRRWILTDTSPDEEHRRTLLLYRPEDRRHVELGRFYTPPELTGEIRCDLHPRWSRDGRRLCFDSAHQGTRQVYVLDVSEVVNAP